MPNEDRAVSQSTDIAPEVQRLNGLIQSNPNDYNAWMDLGRLYFKAGQKESAIQCFQQVLRLRPDAQTLKAWLEKYQAAGN